LCLDDELNVWRFTFKMGNLQKVGIDKKTCDHAVFLERAAEAWSRLGGIFLHTWKPDPGRPIPWAAEQFGNPDD
jgi:hypothetical protein